MDLIQLNEQDKNENAVESKLTKKYKNYLIALF